MNIARNAAVVSVLAVSTFLASTALTAATHVFAAPKDNDIDHLGAGD